MLLLTITCFLKTHVFKSVSSWRRQSRMNNMFPGAPLPRFFPPTAWRTHAGECQLCVFLWWGLVCTHFVLPPPFKLQSVTWHEFPYELWCKSRQACLTLRWIISGGCHTTQSEAMQRQELKESCICTSGSTLTWTRKGYMVYPWNPPLYRGESHEMQSSSLLVSCQPSPRDIVMEDQQLLHLLPRLITYNLLLIS